MDEFKEGDLVWDGNGPPPKGLVFLDDDDGDYDDDEREVDKDELEVDPYGSDVCSATSSGIEELEMDGPGEHEHDDDYDDYKDEREGPVLKTTISSYVLVNYRNPTPDIKQWGEDFYKPLTTCEPSPLWEEKRTIEHFPPNKLCVEYSPEEPKFPPPQPLDMWHKPVKAERGDILELVNSFRHVAERWDDSKEDDKDKIDDDDPKRHHMIAFKGDMPQMCMRWTIENGSLIVDKVFVLESLIDERKVPKELCRTILGALLHSTQSLTREAVKANEITRIRVCTPKPLSGGFTKHWKTQPCPGVRPPAATHVWMQLVLKK